MMQTWKSTYQVFSAIEKIIFSLMTVAHPQARLGKI